MIFLNLFNRLVKRKDVYFQYSTSEQFTGDYWLDGKKIYQKTIQWTSLAVGKSTIALNTPNILNIVDYSVIAKSGVSKLFYKFPSVYYDSGTSGTFYDTYFSLGENVITAFNSTSWNGYTFYATIRYTKTTG